MKVIGVKNVVREINNFINPPRKTIRMNLIESVFKYDTYCYREPDLKDGVYKKLYNFSKHLNLKSKGYKAVKVRDTDPKSATYGKNLNEYVRKTVKHSGYVIHTDTLRWDNNKHFSLEKCAYGKVSKSLKFVNNDGDDCVIKTVSIPRNGKVDKYKEKTITHYDENSDFKSQECTLYKNNGKKSIYSHTLDGSAKDEGKNREYIGVLVNEEVII